MYIYYQHMVKQVEPRQFENKDEDVDDRKKKTSGVNCKRAHRSECIDANILYS